MLHFRFMVTFKLQCPAAFFCIVDDEVTSSLHSEAKDAGPKRPCFEFNVFLVLDCLPRHCLLCYLHTSVGEEMDPYLSQGH